MGLAYIYKSIGKYRTIQAIHEFYNNEFYIPCKISRILHKKFSLKHKIFKLRFKYPILKSSHFSEAMIWLFPYQ